MINAKDRVEPPESSKGSWSAARPSYSGSLTKSTLAVKSASGFWMAVHSAFQADSSEKSVRNARVFSVAGMVFRSGRAAEVLALFLSRLAGVVM